jgi:hypothetical protein
MKPAAFSLWKKSKKMLERTGILPLWGLGEDIKKIELTTCKTI